MYVLHCYVTTVFSARSFVSHDGTCSFSCTLSTTIPLVICCCCSYEQGPLTSCHHYSGKLLSCGVFFFSTSPQSAPENTPAHYPIQYHRCFSLLCLVTDQLVNAIDGSVKVYEWFIYSPCRLISHHCCLVGTPSSQTPLSFDRS